jgi:hypothetical protein
MYVVKWLGMYLASPSYVLGTGRKYAPELQNARTFHYKADAEDNVSKDETVVHITNELETPE